MSDAEEHPAQGRGSTGPIPIAARMAHAASGFVQVHGRHAAAEPARPTIDLDARPGGGVEIFPL